MRRTRGFTLIELMGVVVIIAVLATIAIPMYGKYAYRARRVDGQELLQRIAIAQERFYATSNRYGTLGEIGYADPAISEKEYYQATVAFPTGSNSLKFVAAAAPRGAQQTDACGNLTTNNAGTKGFAGTTTNGACW